MKYRPYERSDQRSLAVWALDCAERVLAFFETARPDDDRPRRAIETGRRWVETGEFRMAVIRGASLAAHAAAKEAGDDAAAAAAHAAGQAVATAHVTQHAYGGAYYALKAIAAADRRGQVANVERERRWQAAQLPDHLRDEVMSRIVVEAGTRGLRITIDKSDGF